MQEILIKFIFFFLVDLEEKIWLQSLKFFNTYTYAVCAIFGLVLYTLDICLYKCCGFMRPSYIRIFVLGCSHFAIGTYFSYK